MRFTRDYINQSITVFHLLKNVRFLLPVLKMKKVRDFRNRSNSPKLNKGSFSLLLLVTHSAP